MCSVFGAYGNPDRSIVDAIAALARDRGRDGGRVEWFTTSTGSACIGNWRATPTTETERGRLQPYDRVVHNGTIANAELLGLKPGQIDSEVLPKVLALSSHRGFRDSLSLIRGSYAIAAVAPDTVYLACNYKPLYYLTRGPATYFSSMERHLACAAEFGVRPAKLPPYSTLDLARRQFMTIPRDDSNRAVVVASAGLDSTTAAAKLIDEGFEVALIHFRYGCNAETREIQAVRRIADYYGVPLAVLDLDYSGMTGSSPLFRPAAPSPGIPGAELAHEWVPARNLVMLSHAVAWAEANGFHTVALGNNLEEAGAYPDNEEEFTTLLDGLLPYAVHADYSMRIVAPVGNLMKREVVALGLRLRVPYALTWSCYRGGAEHCGECGPCFMRRTAFERCGVTDPAFAEVTAA